MGIIKRQGIKTTIVNFTSALVGAISILFIYPLNDEYYGFAQWLYNTAYLLVPLASMGITSLIIKYFPVYTKSMHGVRNGFSSLIFSLLAIAYLIFIVIWVFFKKYLFKGFDLLEMNAEAIREYELFILILLFVLILFQALMNHSTNMLRIVIPNIIQQLGYKLFLPVLVLFSVFYGITREQFAFYILLFFGSAVMLMFIYISYLNGLYFGRIRKPAKDHSYKGMATFSFFSGMNMLSSSLAFRIDSVMIPFLKDMINNGYYNKVLFIANTIEMPFRAISQISAPIISKAWEENDTSEILTVYKKASSNLFLVGSFLFVLIWYILDDLILISSNPDTFPYARHIFLFLGLSKLFNMLTSVNTQIITYSKAYKYNLLFLVILAVSNVVLNYIFIREMDEMGIVGAAMATALSLFLFNVIKLIFIFSRFSLQPFSVSTLKTLFLSLLLLAIYYIQPLTGPPVLTIIIKGIIVSAVFMGVSYFWKISEDINQSINQLIKRII